MLPLFVYNGPVMEFGRVIADKWIGYTHAVTKEKARCNLAYQFKKEHNRVANARITFVNDISIVEEADSPKDLKGDPIYGGVQLKLF